MVLDTSIVLAVFFKEKQSDWALAQMNAHARELRMSTVNLTEALIHLRDRQPQLYPRLEEQLLYHGIRFVPPDVEQARLAAQARIKFPLNLGDCFAYALAVQEDCPILTLDKDFRVLDHTVLYPNHIPSV
ncbi:MAG TPA: type II toxin-antitoxin system VapC family toxin [Gammaproteobacteria bacterium]|nr:type II toxin-antitoxin system VapC family toxin [Gammaproteobacteria bacterium]